MGVIEVQHVGVKEGKEIAKEVASRPLQIPSYRAELNRRWEAIGTGEYKMDEDMKWLVEQVLTIAPTLDDITTQRAIYYMLRGKFPGRKFRGNEISGDKFYQQLVSQGMEKVQLASNLTMQSMGIWSAPRGYIAGDGKINTWKRGTISLSSQPNLNFDLCDVGAKLNSNAKKVIHFEKDAGLSSIVSGDFPKYIEAIFSTSQGQLAEAANKFLRGCEDWGLDIYSIHDADPFGLQMNLIYGLSSKNSCYMSSDFYPNGVKMLGFFPSIAKELKLPPEKIEQDSADFRLFDYLAKVAEEKPELKPEVEIMTSSMKKWEFQALNAIDEQAPKIYIVESLRSKNDSIKFVPEGEIIKQQTIEEVKREAKNEREYAISRAVNDAVELVKQEIEDEIRRVAESKLIEFDSKVDAVVADLQSIDADLFREAVKAELVKDPSGYWDGASGTVARKSFKLTLDINANVDVIANVNDVDTKMNVVSVPPKDAGRKLIKDDIIGSIEKRIIGQQGKRDKVVIPMRKAFDKVFGEPDQVW